MVCHMHQPNVFVNTYLGYTMWDYESDAPSMWPKKQKYPTAAEMRAILDRNPEEAAIRGKWGDPEFLEGRARRSIRKLKDTQFADYHGHGWNFRAVFKRDRKGTLLDKDGKVGRRRRSGEVQEGRAPARRSTSTSACTASTATSRRTAHGNGHIYGEVAAAVEIDCADCHGTADKLPDAAHLRARRRRPAARDLSLLRTPDGAQALRVASTASSIQRSALDPGPRVGDDAGQGHRQPGATRTTTRRPRAPS